MVSSSTRLVISVLLVFVVTVASVTGFVAATAAIATGDDSSDDSSVGTHLDSATLSVEYLDDDLDDEPEETTNETVNDTTDDGENVTESTDNTTDSVENTTEETTNDTTDTVENTTDGTTDVANESGDTINDTTDSTETVVDTAENTTDAIEKTTNETTGAIEDAADETTDVIEETTNEATDSIEETTNETTDAIDDTTTTDPVIELETTTTLTGTPLLETQLDADVSVAASVGDAEADESTDGSLEGTETEVDEESVGNEADEGGENRDGDSTTTDDGGFGFGSPSSPETQNAVNGVLVGLLGAVAVSGMGASAGAGAGAGAGAASSAPSAVASWTGRQPRRWLALLREALPIEALALLRYSRYDDSDPLENDHRRTVFETITEEPGLYLSALSDRSGVALSTVRHHVRVLEDENLLTSVKVGGKRRYFPIEADGVDGMDGVGGTDGADHERYAILAEPARRRVLEELAALEHASNGRLAEALDLDPSTVSHHLTTLEEAGFVVRERDGRAVRNRLSEDARSALLETEADADSSDPASPPAPADD
ncbi:winged helix-turn-helix transcriptional regulator [Saliphagus sp. GCM10025317]